MLIIFGYINTVYVNFFYQSNVRSPTVNIMPFLTDKQYELLTEELFEKKKKNITLYFDGEPVNLIENFTSADLLLEIPPEKMEHKLEWKSYALFKMVKDGQVKMGFEKITETTWAKKEKRKAIEMRNPYIINVSIFQNSLPNSVESLIPDGPIDIYNVVKIPETSTEIRTFKAILRNNIFTVLYNVQNKNKPECDLIDYDSYKLINDVQ